MRTHYHLAGVQITECHQCGETRLCEVLEADSREPETGYLDEYAICEECKNGHTHDWRGIDTGRMCATCGQIERQA